MLRNTALDAAVNLNLILGKAIKFHCLQFLDNKQLNIGVHVRNFLYNIRAMRGE
jgi:hypothetical protein